MGAGKAGDISAGFRAGILSISNRLTGYMLPCLFQHGATVRVRKDRAVWEYW